LAKLQTKRFIASIRPVFLAMSGLKRKNLQITYLFGQKVFVLLLRYYADYI